MKLVNAVPVAAIAAALVLAGCEGQSGPKGDPGLAGAAGAAGVAGADGAKGDKGDKGDPGATGSTGATGATGEKGDKGDKGDPGATGPAGQKGDKGDPGTTGAKGDPGSTGAPGTSTGTLKVRVLDARTGAPLPAAVVTGKLGLPVGGQTDGTGTFQAVVPAGVYQVTASAPRLEVGSATVKPSTVPAQADSDAISVTAGKTATLTVRLERLNLGVVNLTAVHTAGKGIFADDNCKACHSDMQGFASLSETVHPFHRVKTHATLNCTFCHVKIDVNLGNWGTASGASLRKQVDVTKTCKGCHKDYPAKLP